MTTFLEGNVPYGIDQLGLKECGHLLQTRRVIDNGTFAIMHQ